jgi:hypothetical protein
VAESQPANHVLAILRADCRTSATSRTKGDRDDGQQYRVRARSLRQSAELLGRANIIGLVAAWRDRPIDQAGGANCRCSVVARAVGGNLDSRCLIGIRGVRLAIKPGRSGGLLSPRSHERADRRSAARGFVGYQLRGDPAACKTISIRIFDPAHPPVRFGIVE